jgi:hypothetical protein
MDDFDSSLGMYKYIFSLTKEDCKIVGLKLLGNSMTSMSNSATYKFLGIIEADCPYSDYIPTDNFKTKMKNLRFEKISGPSVEFKLKWKVLNKSGKTVKVSGFVIRGQITPHSILEWEVVDGKYYIRLELLGCYD